MTDTELSKAYEPKDVEGRWYARWTEAEYFRAAARSEKPAFCMVLPPPNVTGSLHLGHALTATVQDILARWKRMSGFNTLWVPGTDHAGIATQMVVEKELKKSEKLSRHDLGRETFLKRVWKWKDTYGARIGEQHKVLGASLDWSRERFTMDEQSSTAVREVFVRLHEEGLIYRAQKLINWCPSCRTALSDLEVEHEDQKGSLWHIRYPVSGSDRLLTVATTRPETLLGDTAVAIHPDDPRYAGLVGQKVRLPLTDREIPIIADAELVNPEFGTGVVKVTPAHDFNDYQTGLRHKLPMISLLDEAARTNKEAGAYAGLDRSEARARVLEDLTAQGLLEKVEDHALSVGTCQRCATVVEPRLSPQWFVKIEPLATPAIEAVEQGRTRFVPESWTQTYFHWMRNIHDWCISRQLWWGHQIPAFYCEDCSPRTDTGSLDYERAQPVVARQMPLSCPRCQGSRFTQDSDVLDTWFSSALWPFSTLGWPAQTDELKTFYPTSVLETGHDILFFWVARMMMMGLHFMGEVPFRTVYLHAMVRDEKGDKMSKTKGNVVDPLDIIHGATAEQLLPALRNKFPQGMPAFGADALRFTLASLTQQGRDIKLSMDRVSGYRAFSNKLWNASRFALMNLGDFQLDEKPLTARPLTLADRWILARLQRAVRETQEALTAYNFSDAASTLYQFLWRDFCDWYIELAKGSLYGDDETAKETTRAVLVYSLERTLRLLHPFMPFITEEIWQKLPIQRPVPSLMIAAYPTPDTALEDTAIEAQMAPVIAAIEGLRNIRGESNLSPAARLTAHVQSASSQTRKTFELARSYLLTLAGLAELHVGPLGAKPPQAAAFVGPDMEIYVPLAGWVDLAAERDRIGKEMLRVDQDVTTLRRKLDNPQFMARAPAEVVEKDQARVAELTARKAKLEEHLHRIAPEQPMSAEEKNVSTSGPLPEAGARLHVSGDSPPEGSVDLGKELKEDLAAARLPEPVDSQVEAALTKLREGTKEGLSSSDHYDLGVAYMGMGLVDDAVREFSEAQRTKAPKKIVKQVKKAAKAAVKKVTQAVVKKATQIKKAVKDKAPAKKAKAAPARKAVVKAKAKVKAKAAPARKAAVKAKAQVKRAATSAKKAAKAQVKRVTKAVASARKSSRR